MTSSASSSPSRKVLSKIACLRLQKELGEWQASPPGGFTYKIAQYENHDGWHGNRWVIEVSGAEGTLYAGETYRPQVDFPEQYPMEAPQLVLFWTALMVPAPARRRRIEVAAYASGLICPSSRSSCSEVGSTGSSWSSASSGVLLSLVPVLLSFPRQLIYLEIVMAKPSMSSLYDYDCLHGLIPPVYIDTGGA
ncbi:hypothetical protein VPH35_071184 [Triticum aestivum]